MVPVHYYGKGGVLDCEPESKTGEIPKSHIFREGGCVLSFFLIFMPQLLWLTLYGSPSIASGNRND